MASGPGAQSCYPRSIFAQSWRAGLTDGRNIKNSGGEGGIRTPGRSFGPYNGLANRRIQPLCHLSAVWFQQLTTLPQLIWRTVGAQSFMASKVVSIFFIAARTAGAGTVRMHRPQTHFPGERPDGRGNQSAGFFETEHDCSY